MDFSIKKLKKFENKMTPNGFTLVEMITAVAIFSIVMVIAMGALLSVLSANKQNQAMQTVISNLNLALETMSREIRTGYTYHCGSTGQPIDATQDCPGGENFFAFEAHDGDSGNGNDQIVFKLEAGQIKKSENSDNSSLSLTSADMVVENLAFYVIGTDITDNIQPRVLVNVNGYVDKGSVGDRGKSYFNLQTTISQRLIDF